MRTGELKKCDREKCAGGYVLYSAYSGESFFLMDREGNVVKEWRVGGPVKLAQLLPNGHLVYARMRDGVFELDTEGNEIWRFHCRQHHDFERMENGNTLILANEFIFNPRVRIGAIDKNAVYYEVDPQGKVVWEWHSDRHIDELTRLVGLKFPVKDEDWTHCNTVESIRENDLGKKDARFKAGNVIFSHRNLDTIGVIEKESGEIVWAWGVGELDKQHMPTMLANGRMLIFDNGPKRGYSRVIEIDPPSGEIVWEYRLPDYAFARALSGQELLPNGNLLICAGSPGIILEVTREGEIVWEFHNSVIGQRGDNSVYRACFVPEEHAAPYL